MSKLVDNNIRNAERIPLGEILPLDFPFSLQVSATHVCNFNCFYCIHGNKNYDRNYPRLGKMMNYEDFKTYIDNLKKSGIFKTVMFIGYGEPLTHPSIVDMVRYAKSTGATLRTEIITNASLLTPELSDKLVGAGLDRLRISLQGLSSDEYLKTTAKTVDYEKLINNITYFYNHRGNCKVVIKIFDQIIDTPEKKDNFCNQFGDICDDIWIESISKINGLINEDDKIFETDKFGNIKREIEICSFPFYSMVLDYNGDLYGCCQTENPPLIGNASEKFSEIWNKNKHLRLIMGLAENKNNIPDGCKNCRYYIYHTYPSDIIDDSAKNIFDRINRKCADL
jgi:radical SAM protein with 4Fe4S-binding SPASM domain